MLPFSIVVRTKHLTREQIDILREKISQKLDRLSVRFNKKTIQPHIVIQITSRGQYMYELVVKTSFGGREIVEKSTNANVFAALENCYDSFKENLLQQSTRLARRFKHAWLPIRQRSI